jgi:transcriptional regulator with XRE-family HTH domain
MANRESLATLGASRSRLLRGRIGDELAGARRAVGLSLREVGRRVGVSPQRVARAERGSPSALTIDLAARIAPVVGLQLAASLFPSGDAVRDAGHLRLLSRFRARLHASVRWRSEVPVPITGDARSGDAVITVKAKDLLVEAETHLGDIQALERRAGAKARDLGVERVVLLVASTRHNRNVIALHPELYQRFPIGTRACLAALARGEDPGGDCLVIL